MAEKKVEQKKEWKERSNVKEKKGGCLATGGAGPVIRERLGIVVAAAPQPLYGAMDGAHKGWMEPMARIRKEENLRCHPLSESRAMDGQWASQMEGRHSVRHWHSGPHTILSPPPPNHVEYIVAVLENCVRQTQIHSANWSWLTLVCNTDGKIR